MESITIYDPGIIFANLGYYESYFCLSIPYVNTLQEGPASEER